VALVAAILKLNQQTVRNWLDQGSLSARHLGRRVPIRRTDFDRMLVQGYTGCGGERTATTSLWHGEIPAPDSS
jgi:excisionase family DNA binding protein